MKVLHLINTLSAGGAERHLLWLCRDLRSRGVETVVACLRERVPTARSLRPDFEEAGIPVVDLAAESRYDAAFPLRVARLVAAERPDVLHTHLPRADLGGLVAAALYPGIRWICSVHDVHEGSWSARRLLPVYRLVWRRPETVIAVSGAVRDWLVGSLGIPKRAIRVVRYGIDLERYRPAVRRLAPAPLVGSVGRLEPRKGHETLVRAFELVVRDRPSARLSIAGHDPFGHGARLAALIGACGLETSVRLVGFEPDVPSFLRTLDVFAFASRSEGLPHAVLEAMAAELPLVASRIPPIAEIVEDGTTGFLVDPDDVAGFAAAILLLARDRATASRLGRRAREKVLAEFSTERTAEGILAVYERAA
jgi:glycosyltransferase involved in cell wall biosynthesis